MCKKCDLLQAAIDKHIAAVRAADKTPDYAYSQQKGAANRFGRTPPAGSRWLTPRELVDVLWLDCVKIMNADEVDV